MRTPKRFLEIFNLLHQSLMEMVSMNKLVGIITKKQKMCTGYCHKKKKVCWG